jgi:amino acid adenylation domain-containing protein
MLAGTADTLCLDRDADALAREDDGNLEARTRPDDLSYVIYTSGSTGAPKGVLVTDANVVRLFESTRHQFDFGEHDVWTMFHSPTFDFSVWEIWGALLHGGRLVVVPYETARSPDALIDLMAAERVTVLNQTPTAFWEFMRAESVRERPLPSLRLIFCGGEKLDIGPLRRWFERHGDRVKLVNGYGITETTVFVTFREIQPGDLAKPGSPIGRPLPDLDVYLLDRRGRLVPVGVTGEIHVGGAGLARGYLNRPELTAERFQPHPFSSSRTARLYSSGDLARHRTDGDLEFLGRMDDQIKIRGFRVEPGEIEAAIRDYAGVREAVVAMQEPAPGDRRLVAYVVWEVPNTDSGGLRRFVETRLPDYMVPASFVAMPALPHTSSGKVDRSSLPMPEPARGGDDGFVAPRDAVERLLADVWCELLRVERVSALDDFFDLGGHSLLAIRLISRVRELLSVELPVRAVFESSSLAGMAAAIVERGEARGYVERAAELSLHLRTLSDEEVGRLLARERELP